jgi:DNA-binding transcriptional regulator YiaG
MGINGRDRNAVGGSAKDGPSKEVDYAKPNDASKIRELLVRAGLSQRGAARELDVDERTMRYWCAGDVATPRMAVLALERLIDVQKQIK